MGKRELVALLNLSSWCLVMVERLFLAVLWGCLRFMIVVFPDHTHLLFLAQCLQPEMCRGPEFICALGMWSHKEDTCSHVPLKWIYLFPPPPSPPPTPQKKSKNSFLMFPIPQYCHCPPCPPQNLAFVALFPKNKCHFALFSKNHWEGPSITLKSTVYVKINNL